jgi:hypothetical protein
MWPRLPIILAAFFLALSALGADRRMPSLVPEAPYVSSQACLECHPKEHASWHRTYHRTMTQVATPETVAGKFDGTTVESDGLRYTVREKNGELFAEMPDPDVMMYIVQGGRDIPLARVPRVELPVVMATGSHHYQTYWVSSKRYDALLQTLPLVYLLEDRRWVPREEAFLRGPADRGRLITQWNHHCIRCHSTGGNPGLDEQTGMLRTRVAELGIACEACHGPGEEHVKKQRALRELSEALAASDTLDRTIVNPAKLDHRRSAQVCGQCHGVYVTRNEFAMQSAKEGPLYRPGEDLDRTRYYMLHPNSHPTPESRLDLEKNPEFYRERWWDDGTVLAGGREYTALLASGCYTKGQMSCLSCHSMHRSDPVDQLKPSGMDGRSCQECHREPKYNEKIREHTFHEPNSSGSACLNCHMPHTTYALFKAIRSHQISSPNVAASARHGTPNACNLCHLDRTLAWTQEALADRYAQPKTALTTEQQNISAFLLWLVKGHAAQRAVAAWHGGWQPAQEASGTNWLAPFLAQTLSDSYGVVRYIGARSTRTLPGFEKMQYDFLAAPRVLATNTAQAVEIWQTSSGAYLNPATNILIGSEGKLMRAKLQELVEKRDNRSVTVKE